MIITAYNPSTDNLEKSYLSASYPAGTTTLVLRNTNKFSSSTTSRIMIGELGREKTEIVTVSNVNADKITLTVGATAFPHSADDPVYVLKYDQIKFYRSTTAIDGTYSSLATVAMDVDNADKMTHYDDVAGLTSYFYKITFYHSVDAVESSQSDPMPGTGYTRSQVGTVVNEFLTEVDDLQQNYVTVPQLLGWINEVNDDLTSQSRRPYRFLYTSASLSITAGNDRVAIPTTILKFDRLKYNYDFLGTDRSDNIRVIDIEEMEYLKYDNTALTSNELLYVAIDYSTNELVMHPVPTDAQPAKFTIYYWQMFTNIDSLGDTLETPTPRIYKLFLAGRFFRKRGMKEASFLPISDRYVNDYNAEVVKLQRMNKLDVGSPAGMKPDTNTERGLRKF